MFPPGIIRIFIFQPLVINQKVFVHDQRKVLEHNMHESGETTFACLNIIDY